MQRVKARFSLVKGVYYDLGGAGTTKTPRVMNLRKRNILLRENFVSKEYLILGRPPTLRKQKLRFDKSKSCFSY